MQETAATLGGTDPRKQATNPTSVEQAARKEKGGEDEGSNDLPPKEKNSEQESANGHRIEFILSQSQATATRHRATAPPQQ